ncbi:PHP domain-containing protein [Myxococcota bacterium]|nr:PHP domain-containing protein [Myxococcota bacterium]
MPSPSALGGRAGSPAPLSPRARFDLHLHSTRSDGRLSPAQVLDQAARNGLDVIALTDHDCAPALPWGPVRVAGRTVHVLHAAEVSGAWDGREQHLLVYFPQAVPTEFARLMRSLCMARAQRYERAAEGLGLAGLTPPDEAAWRGERALTRVHLSQAIVDAGHAGSLEDAFARYTASRLGRVPPVDPTFPAVIRMARAAGGLTSWAHPQLDAVQAHLSTFVAAGLQALEAARPGLRGQERSTLLRLAHKHGLLVTGGSDNHGFPWQHPVGQWTFPMREARPFARALGLPT